MNGQKQNVEGFVFLGFFMEKAFLKKVKVGFLALQQNCPILSF